MQYCYVRLQINNSAAQVVRNGALVPLAWQFVRVGDIVRVRTQPCVTHALLHTSALLHRCHLTQCEIVSVLRALC